MSKVYCFSTCKADGNNLYLLASDYGIGASSVFKVNTNGDSLFRVDLTFLGLKIVSDDNGGLILTGKNNTIRLDVDGNIVWQTENTYNTIDYWVMIKTTSGKYLACGANHVFMIDVNANQIWSKWYVNPFYKRYYSVIETSDGGFLLGGEYSDGVGLPILGVITKIDSTGSFLWEQRYTAPDPQNGIREMKLMKLSNCYYAGGNYYDASLGKQQNVIMKLDSLGNVLSVKKLIYNPYFHCYANDYKILNGGKFLTVGIRYKNVVDSSSAFAFISDTSGTILKLKEYVVSKQNQLYGISIFDSKYILSGGTNYFSVNNYNLYAIKTDSTLDAPPVSVINISSEVPNLYSLSQNYPNPFNPVTKIKFSVVNGFPVKTSGNDKIVLKVYDVMGREVQTLVNESLMPGLYETTFDGSQFSSGVYLYKLMTDGFSTTKKMILLK